MRAGVMRVFGKRQSSDAPPTLGMWRNRRVGVWETGLYTRALVWEWGCLQEAHAETRCPPPGPGEGHSTHAHACPCARWVGKWGPEILSQARWGGITA